MTLEQLFQLCPDKYILSEAGGFSQSDLILKKDIEIEENLCNKIIEFYNLNKQGIPLAYLTNKRSFYRDVFHVQKGVLIPQPDTETLVDETVKTAGKFNKEEISILDLCAGTGCIGISVAKELSSYFKIIRLHLSDISQTAFECFSKNAENLIKEKNIQVFKHKGNLFEDLKTEKFDLIVSNPPYIPSDTIPTLSEEVKNEPVLALDGGKDGLDFYRAIALQAKDFLNHDSFLLMEIGYDQGETVPDIMKKSGYRDIEIVRDLSGNDRVVKCLYK